MNNLYETGLLWIVLFPLVGAFANGLFGRFAEKRLVGTVAVGSVLFSFVFALVDFVQLTHLRGLGAENPVITADVYRWFALEVQGRTIGVDVRFAMDSLSGLMTVMVTGIGLLIHVYSLGYMSEEKSYARFFAYLNLFMASMLILVLASNFPLLFVGWEGVGLCSYLLIGFWYENGEYAVAGKKAFIANRIGDFGVLVGMFLLMSAVGSFEFADINRSAGALMGAPVAIGGLEIGTVATVAALFLFLGCAGKSAQIPLYVWLPDAMAGPTPVSALIHAATMVTAGVYLCCRLSPVFVVSETATAVIALVGTATALLAATIAVAQREMKKILAYSTVSQLGFMFAAVGTGAFAAGFFHVFTHAFFKACLFLGAGSVMHAVGAHGDADIFKLGGLRTILPKTSATFFIACLAIAGVPPLAGFFSKDEILVGAALMATGGEEAFGWSWVGWTVLIGLFVTATLTAFYMFRLYYLTFSGTYRSGEGAHADQDAHHGHGYGAHPHESPFSMTFPLIVLAGGAIVAGFLGLPHWIFHHGSWWGPWLDGVVASVPGHGPHDEVVDAWPYKLAMGAGFIAAGVGVLLAIKLYRGASKDSLAEALPARLYRFLFDKWRVDELYEAVLLRPIRRLAVLVGRLDQILVDGLLTKVTSHGVAAAGWLLARLQVGVVHAYGLVMVVGAMSVAWWFLYPHASVEVEAGDSEVTFTAAAGLGYEYRWDADDDGEPEQDWSAEGATLHHRYVPEDYVGYSLMVGGRPDQDDQEIELDEDAQSLASLLQILPGEAAPAVPPVAFVRDEAVIIRPNDAELRGGAPVEGEEGAFSIPAGGTARLGATTIRVVGRVRAAVEVRNVFGNRTKKTIDVTLGQQSEAHASLGGER